MTPQFKDYIFTLFVSSHFAKKLKAMNSVDRIVIQTSPDKEFEITDMELIKKIVSEAMTAKTVGYTVTFRDNYIFLYHGDALVREMSQWEGSDRNIVEVYHVDDNHFNFWGFPTGVGVTILSKELVAELDLVVEQAYSSEHA